MAKLKRQEPSAFKKAIRLIDELFEHPRTGTGKPELLSGDRAGQWSRRITKKHRLVYEIHDMEIIVIVISTYGNYGDK
jgi:toxin YoeB